MVPSAAHLVLATPQISREELAERTRDLLVEAEGSGSGHAPAHPR